MFANKLEAKFELDQLISNDVGFASSLNRVRVLKDPSRGSLIVNVLVRVRFLMHP